jgi:hypothetical protein
MMTGRFNRHSSVNPTTKCIYLKSGIWQSNPYITNLSWPAYKLVRKLWLIHNLANATDTMLHSAVFVFLSENGLNVLTLLSAVRCHATDVGTVHATDTRACNMNTLNHSGSFRHCLRFAHTVFVCLQCLLLQTATTITATFTWTLHATRINPMEAELREKTHFWASDDLLLPTQPAEATWSSRCLRRTELTVRSTYSE